MVGLDAPQILAHVARQPVGLAQLVQHGAADALNRVGLELRALRVVEVLGRIEQADQARLDQIVHLHAGRQPRHEVIGDPLHQRRHLLDELALIRGEGGTRECLAPLIQFEGPRVRADSSSR